MNTLLYDLKTKTIIDVTGKGIHDAVDGVLRWPSADWNLMLRTDRLFGMRLLR